ncbi:MAG: alpha/beta fold hydrolase [Victivallales bacterium]|nr:alpha/beta fold hydrolase [Victivallales bacterium]
MNRIGRLGLCMVLAAVAATADVVKDIPYYEEGAPKRGNLEYLEERCKLDLSTPSNFPGFSTIIWVHGGGLTKGGKSFPRVLDKEMVGIVAVNYRLSGERAECPDYLYDTAAAVAWTLKHIAEYGGDPNKVYLTGHSAGGWLVAMVTLDPKYLATFGAKPTQLAASWPLSGQMTTHFNVLAERRAKDKSTPSVWLDEYAPIYLARSEFLKGVELPELFFVVGDTTLEMPSRVEENRLIEARLRRVLRRTKTHYIDIETGTHSSMSSPGLALLQSTIWEKIKAERKAEAEAKAKAEAEAKAKGAGNAEPKAEERAAAPEAKPQEKQP